MTDKDDIIADFKRAHDLINQETTRLAWSRPLVVSEALREPIRVAYGDFRVSNELPQMLSKGNVELDEVQIIGEITFITEEDANMTTASLDYLLQYSVKRLLVPKDGHQWALEFNNGAIVTNDDPENPAPPESVVGLQFLTAIYGQKDTRLRLGHVQQVPGQDTPKVIGEILVTFIPGHYKIIDPRFEGETIPQDAGAEDAVTLDKIREEFNKHALEAPENGSPGTEGYEASDVPSPAQEATDEPTDAPRIDTKRTSELTD